MAWQLLNRRYTIGTVDGSGDITPGAAQTGFLDFTALTAGNDTYVVAVQGANWSYMTVRKVGAILRPQTTHDSSSGSSITFDTGLPISVFSDLGKEHAVYVDANGDVQNADALYLTFAPEDLTALKTTPLPSSGKSVRYLRGIVAFSRTWPRRWRSDRKQLRRGRLSSTATQRGQHFRQSRRRQQVDLERPRTRIWQRRASIKHRRASKRGCRFRK